MSETIESADWVLAHLIKWLGKDAEAAIFQNHIAGDKYEVIIRIDTDRATALRAMALLEDE